MNKFDKITAMYGKSAENSEKTPVLGENSENTAENTAENQTDTNKKLEENSEKTAENIAENQTDITTEPVETIPVELVQKDELISSINPTEPTPVEPVETAKKQAEPKKPKPVEPEPKNVGQEIKDKIGQKPSEIIEGFGGHVLKTLDNVSAALCARISGEPSSNFKSDKDTLELVHKSVTNYAKSKEMKPLTPFKQMVIAVLIWQTPLIYLGGKEIGNKLIDKLKPKKEVKPKLIEKSKEEEVHIPIKPLKEVEEGRTRFEIHATTKAYKYDLKGDTVKVALAKDYPSDKILKLIEEKKTNKEIREILSIPSKK